MIAISELHRCPCCGLTESEHDANEKSKLEEDGPVDNAKWYNRSIRIAVELEQSCVVFWYGNNPIGVRYCIDQILAMVKDDDCELDGNDGLFLLCRIKHYAGLAGAFEYE